jgi:hypothetical protein
MKSTAPKNCFVPIFLLMSFAALHILTSCSSMAVYDQYAYQETVSLKVDALNLMDKAKEDQAMHQTEIDQLSTRIQKMLEYEKGREKNTLTVALWNDLLDPKKHLFGGFIKKWKEGIQEEVFIAEMKMQVNDAFDTIISLESKKIK